MKRPKKNKNSPPIMIFSTIFLVTLFILFIWRSSADRNALYGPQIPPLNLAGTVDSSNPKSEYSYLLKDKNLFEGITNEISYEDVAEKLVPRLGLKTADTDSDGLSDLAEILIYGTNVFYFDSDLDTIADSVEIANLTNPLSDKNILTKEDRYLVAYRIEYWGSDFSLADERSEISARDLLRIAEAGQIVVLMNLYYAREKHYPLADSWEGAWVELVSKNHGNILFKGSPSKSMNIFRENGAGEIPLDPLNTDQYVYKYNSFEGGSGYVFSYALEARKVLRTQKVTEGNLGEVVEEFFD